MKYLYFFFLDVWILVLEDVMNIRLQKKLRTLQKQKRMIMDICFQTFNFPIDLQTIVDCS